MQPAPSYARSVCRVGTRHPKIKVRWSSSLFRSLSSPFGFQQSFARRKHKVNRIVREILGTKLPTHPLLQTADAQHPGLRAILCPQPVLDHIIFVGPGVVVAIDAEEVREFYSDFLMSTWTVVPHGASFSVVMAQMVGIPVSSPNGVYPSVKTT